MAWKIAKVPNTEQGSFGGISDMYKFLGWSYLVASAMRRSNGIVGGGSSAYLNKAYLSVIELFYAPPVQGAYNGGSNGTYVCGLPINTQCTPFNVGWTKTPAGWKRSRAATPLNKGNAGWAGIAKLNSANIANHNGVSTGSDPVSPTLGYTSGSGIGLFGDGAGKDIWLESQVTSEPWAGQFDLSFLDMPGIIPAGCKANKAYRMYLLMCCFWFDNPASYGQGCFFGDGSATVDQGVTVNLRTGDLASLDPETSPTDTIVASFIVGGNEFSIPDRFGRFYLNSTKAVTATAAGTITYAELLGGTRADGVGPDGRCKLYIPVSEVPALNCIAVDRKAVTAGQTVNVYDFGLQYKMGD